MDQITLHIWIISANEALTNELNKCRNVSGVTYDFHTAASAWDIGHIEGTYDHLIITDQLNQLMPFFNQRGTSLIYIGTSTELCKLTRVPPNNLLEIWDPDAPVVFRSSRLYHAATDHINAYHEWLYRSYLMATIDSVQDPIWFRDMKGLYWLVNNKFEDTVKKTRTQIYGMDYNSIWDIAPEEGNDAASHSMEADLEVMKHKESIVTDETVTNAKGMRHFITRRSPIYDRSGMVMGTVGIARDVTDLNNASLQLQILIDSLPIAVLVTNAEWNGMQINSRFSEEFLLRTDPEDKEPFSYTKWRDQKLTAIKERTYDDATHSYSLIASLTRDDITHVYSITEQEIRDYFDNIIGYYCIYNDITDTGEYKTGS